MEKKSALRPEFEKFLEDLFVNRKRSFRTSEVYRQVLGDFNDFLSTKSKMSELSSDTARNFIRSKAPHIKASTQALIVSVLRQFSRWQQRELNDGSSSQHIVGGVAWQLKAPKVPKRMSKVFSEEDLSLLLETISKKSCEEQILFHLLYGSALRISEALTLTWNQLDFVAARARVLGKGSRWRVVPLTPELCSLLKQLSAKEGLLQQNNKRTALGAGAFWHSGINYLQAKNWVQAWGRESGLSKDIGTLNPHRLRHALASHLIRRGGRLPHIQKLLGHKKLATTERYTHLEINDLLRVYDQSLPKKLVE